MEEVGIGAALLALLVVVPAIAVVVALLGGLVGASVTMGYNVFLDAGFSLVRGAWIGSIIGLLSGASAGGSS